MTQLIVALDVEEWDDAALLVRRLQGVGVMHYKIGLEALCAGWGHLMARDLRAADYRVMLDPKLHDIPETVTRATARLLAHEPAFVTVHAYPQTMAAAQRAVEARPNCSARVLGVTVLTSMTDDDLMNAGYAKSAANLVWWRTNQAREAGIGGVVCSPQDLTARHHESGDGLLRVVPGIRPAAAQADDQRRVATPAAAARAGADFIVVGRPITRAPDPREAAITILREIEEADA